MSMIDTRQQPTITCDGAQRIVAAGLRKARELGAPSTVAVVDASGVLTCIVRKDGAAQIGADLARRKAYTAIVLGVPTAQTAAAVAEAPALAAAVSAIPGVSVLQGGVPLEVDEQIVGAVGVSSPTPGPDTIIAAAAAAALGNP